MSKKVGLIILDGIGLAKKNKANAFSIAKTPTISYLLKNYPHCKLLASGKAVGLPKGQPGNSEIGHLNIGAGKSIKSELLRINEDLDSHRLTKNKNLKKVFELVKTKRVKLHVIGLTSFGGVHSNLKHITTILEECGRQQIPTIFHCISDGRDCKVNSLQTDIKRVLKISNKYSNVKIGTIAGRYYAMDRDNNWWRTNKMLEAMIHIGPSFKDVSEYICNSYKKKITDEFIIPAYNVCENGTKLNKNDIVLFLNFRSDRSRQFAHLIKKSNLFKHQSKVWKMNLFLVTIVPYDGINANLVLYPAQNIKNTLGEIIAKNNLKQLRIAETEKYAHVTYFFDGGKELNLPREDKILIPSPKVPTYDLKPEMSAKQLTNKLLSVMHNYDFIVCNYANCDMVGHTGKMKPTIKAIETVDACLKQIVLKAKQIGMTLFITSDHGNCDKMLDIDNNTVTSHTSAPVFFISTDKKVKLKDGSLKDIASTIMNYFKFKNLK